MNKNITFIIIALLMLGMGLIMYNEYTASSTKIAAIDAQPSMVTRPVTSPPPTPPTPPTPQAPITAAPPSAALSMNNATPVQDTQNQQSASAALEKPQAIEPKPNLAPGQASLAHELSKEAPEPLAAPFEKKAIDVPSPIAEAAPAPQKTEQAPSNIVAKPTVSSPKETAPPAKEVVKEPSPKAEVQKTTTKLAIKNIKTLSSGKWFTIRLEGTIMPRYTYMRLSSPERLVVDLIGDWDIKAIKVPENPFVSIMRIGEQKNATRVVFDLKKVPAEIVYWKFGETGLDVRMR